MSLCNHCGSPFVEDARFCARCGAAVSADAGGAADPLIGRTVGGAYLLQELIGLGGMGRVYRAEQSMLGRTVAVKVIHPHLLGDDQSVARFYTEARAASRLNHPNSVSIIDFGRTDDGVLYLVMEHLAGRDLACILEEEGPLPFGRALDIIVGVLAALGEAHALGVVHRDLKPENIILRKLRTGGDLIKVVDFGLATLIGAGNRSSITLPGVVCGTPDYISPEQGRGESVDGRGDIYAVGVMLFELLTDRLPFIDDTPTKVVLRHISEAPPDPREVAPHRGIPDLLAEITLKALSKDPARRYQSAEEMQKAVLLAIESLRPSIPSKGDLVCPACGRTSPPGSRFCRECGAALTPSAHVRLSTAPPPIAAGYPRARAQQPMVGRDSETVQIEALRSKAAHGVVWLRIAGEAGVGKSRLVAEVADWAAADGDSVVGTGPDPTGALIAYGPIRRLMADLLEVDDSNLELGADALGIFQDPLARAGLAEIAEAEGLRGSDSESRAGAVAAALAHAIRFAASRSASGRAFVFVDDSDRCDGLTRAAFAELPRFLHAASALIIQISVAVPDRFLHEGETVIELRGLPPSEIGKIVRSASLTSVFGGQDSDGGTRLLLPLYVEQIQALGPGAVDEESLPLRLADAITQRTERLDVSARRLLQAICVLGERCPLPWVQELVSADEMASLHKLVDGGLVELDREELQVNHPFIRDLVQASIPAEARKLLHDRAMHVVSSHGAPLEIRCEHAFRGSEPLTALLLLERAGGAALMRGDYPAAVLHFRRGLDLARRELLERGDESLDAAVLGFSRKLGDALDRMGEVTGADGVLREAVDLAGPTTIERARMLALLGRVAARRERRRDAARLWGQSLEICTKIGDLLGQAQAQLGLARLRRGEGERTEATQAYRRAIELLESQLGQPAQRTIASFELGELLIDSGDIAGVVGAKRELERAHRIATDADLPHLCAMAMGTLASVDELEGNRDDALARYKEAAALAARAGDADGFERWERATAALTRGGANSWR